MAVPGIYEVGRLCGTVHARYGFIKKELKVQELSIRAWRYGAVREHREKQALSLCERRREEEVHTQQDIMRRERNEPP
jgi:hypothetical protein